MSAHRLALGFPVLTLVLVMAGPVHAQDPAGTDVPAGERRRLHGGLGVGAGTEGVGGALSLALRTTAGDFVFRSSGTSDFVNIFEPTEEVSDVALLYGRTRVGDSGWIRLSAGPAYVTIKTVGGRTTCFIVFCAYEVERHRAVGLAVQLDAGTNPRRFLGLGLTGFLNVNAKRSFAGAAVSLHVGRVTAS